MQINFEINMTEDEVLGLLILIIFGVPVLTFTLGVLLTA